jgi:hypothetical protein
MQGLGGSAVVILTLAFLFGIPKPTLAQTGSGQPLITQAVDNTKLTVLKGNTHPLARPEFDHGPAPASLPMQRMLLVLTRSAQQEAALQTLLQQQQYKASASYHKWLTPEEFGEEFGASEQDIQTITAWLEAQGFEVAGVSNGRGVIEFSGTAGQVQQAFHTTIHNYVVNGEQHWANASDPQIPSALAPAVVGVDSLNNFAKKAEHHLAGGLTARKATGKQTTAKPALTYACGTNDSGETVYCNALGPYDFAAIYNVLPLWNATPSIDGAGETIALIGRSNINLQDVSNFRSLFGLPANVPQVILDGPDPGVTGDDDETEADLDVEWSGGVAKAATIKLVVSESTESTDGVDLSAEYAVDNDVAPIISESFGNCELAIGTAGNQFYSDLWEQAAAEGISVFTSAGDNGAAGCDYYEGTTPEPAENGLEVSGITSTPYNVSVGGTDFNDFFNPQLYWNTTSNATTQQSAIGYIPETTWNDSCTNAIFGELGWSTNPETNCNDSELSDYVVTLGGSGGQSNCTTPSGSTESTCSGGYTKPPWQTGNGVPADGKRDVPDVSLFASNGFLNNFYAICESDVTDGSCASPSDIVGIGGTSASSPTFAALLALVEQKTGATQGNPNFVLYKLAEQQSASSCNSSTGPASTCVFNDITSGTIAMPCATGSPNCTGFDSYGILSGYNAGTGYDQATGLGSVNTNNLVNDWNSVTFTPSTTALTLNGGSAVNITHGSTINVNVSVSPTSPEPTGAVSLIATQGSNTLSFDTLTLSDGAASGTTNMLPGGTSYTVKAHYGGDTNYGGSDSNAVTVTVTPEASKTFANLVTFDMNGNLTSYSANSATYGTNLYLFRADVGNSSATFSSATGISSTCSNRVTTCPTGTVSLTNNGTAFDGGGLLLNADGYAEDQSISPGTYAISASYPGDASYGSSTTTADFTISKAPTTVSAGAAGSPIEYGNYTQIGAAILTTSYGAAPTGTVTFSLDGAPVTMFTLTYEGFPYSPGGSSPEYANLNATGLATFLTLGTHSLTAQYSGDANYAAGTSPPTTITVTQALPFFTTFGASPGSVNVNQQVTLSADMVGSDAGVAPTGTMTFYENGTPISGSISYTPEAHSLLASMSYTPVTVGTENITVSYSGDANYLSAKTPTAATLTVTGPDFAINVSGSISQTVNPGQSATFSNAVSVSALDGFSAQVNLSCTTGAADTTCSVAPSALAPGGGSATVTVTTTGNGEMPPARVTPMRYLPEGLAALFAVLLASFFGSMKARVRLATAIPSLVILLLLFLAVGVLAGCGGGGAASNPPPPSGTQAGSYVVTVTGTSGALTHTGTLTLVVQ